MTGVLCAAGRIFQDWSADYRLYQRGRCDLNRLYEHIIGEVLTLVPETRPLVVAVDDTRVRKRGTKIPGVGYTRDPLGPPFRVHLIRAQRFLQMAATLPEESGAARTIPIDFWEVPLFPKPRRTATPEEWQHYREQRQQWNVCRQAGQRLERIRQLIRAQQPSRALWVTVDGGLTNQSFLQSLPAQTIMIGRIRHDAKMYQLPGEGCGKGRQRVYGAKAPTPEQVRQDIAIPWQTVPVYACGKYHEVRIKTITQLKWPKAGQQRILRLIVIAPLSYRLRQNSRLLYRKPAYLICTDPGASVAAVVQAFVRRWGIEVNFRDEKTLLGVGQAQVRHPQSVPDVPRARVAAYAALLLAAWRMFPEHHQTAGLPPPKWHLALKKQRYSTADLIKRLRYDLWGEGLSIENNNLDFVNTQPQDTNAEKLLPNLKTAVFYASN